jgi:hypothetical protein
MLSAEIWPRIKAYGVSAGMTALVLSPLFTGAPDSFPISDYPMFARRPGQPTLFAIVGAAADGSERRLAPALIGSGEVLQTKALIQRSVQLGPSGMADLCQATAERVADSPSGATLAHVDIVRRRYDPIGYFMIGPTPIEQERLFRCAIPQTVPAGPSFPREP